MDRTKTLMFFKLDLCLPNKSSSLNLRCYNSKSDFQAFPSINCWRLREINSCASCAHVIGNRHRVKFCGQALLLNFNPSGGDPQNEIEFIEPSTQNYPKECYPKKIALWLQGCELLQQSNNLKKGSMLYLRRPFCGFFSGKISWKTNYLQELRSSCYNLTSKFQQFQHFSTWN